jgi:hypothetical protein
MSTMLPATMSTMLIIGGAVVSVAVLAIALLFRRDGSREPDMGSVSRSWTIEYNASHGKDPAGN